MTHDDMYTSCQKEQRLEVDQEQAAPALDSAYVDDLSLATSECRQMTAAHCHLSPLLHSLQQ